MHSSVKLGSPCHLNVITTAVLPYGKKFQLLAIYNIEHLPNSIIIGPSRSNILPSTKLTLQNCQRLLTLAKVTKSHQPHQPLIFLKKSYRKMWFRVARWCEESGLEFLGEANNDGQEDDEPQCRRQLDRVAAVVVVFAATVAVVVVGGVVVKFFSHLRGDQCLHFEVSIEWLISMHWTSNCLNGQDVNYWCVRACCSQVRERLSVKCVLKWLYLCHFNGWLSQT